VRASNEKMLGANLPGDYVESFWNKAFPKGVKATKTDIVLAMADAWVELPPEVKEYYLYPKRKEDSIRDHIERIVEDKMESVLPDRIKAMIDEDQARKYPSHKEARKKKQDTG